MQSMGGGAAGYMISTGTTPISATGGTKATPGPSVAISIICVPWAEQI